ncbi:MAG TPA: hypothetical protein VFI42_06355 [Thermomicrobiaceae bacterium]|nr:hypothetical protein [Thermomicrobiaceae bacterium]
MSQTAPEHISDQPFIDHKLAGARYQIDTLRRLVEEAGHQDAAESCACAAIEQLLQVVAAALQQLNLQLPQPLPASRVNLRNLRDEFQSVQAESAGLQLFEQAERPGVWLDRLRQQQLGSTFAPLLRQIDGGYQLYRDPLEPDAGVEPEAPAEYLDQAARQVEMLVRRAGARMPDDTLRFREGRRKQTRRLI